MGGGIILGFREKSNIRKFDATSIALDFPEESPLRKLIEALMSGRKDKADDTRKELENAEVAKKLSEDIEKAGESFQFWLKEFKNSGGNTFGFFPDI